MGVVAEVQRNPPLSARGPGSRRWYGEGLYSPTVLLASPQALGWRTKGIPPELRQLAILMLVQTV